ncbi:increased DNA methylation 3 [Andrographis paniculata]|uniref:increased DNA methylation 3 n=1 Tax=Andrographis paniculata TaxID=175694 RepID=UPI0021E716EB|nr:increased DNA methylation 3 [Andrographis paniculata]
MEGPVTNTIMDGPDPEELNETPCKRSKTQMDAANEIETPTKYKDPAEENNHCDSLQLSVYPRTSSDDLPPSFALPLVPIPKVEEWCLNSNIVLTGTACRVGTGPPVGAVDIGESKSAYYFCISLPGVKKDPGEFSCEIQKDGKVCIHGVTSTGAKTITKYSRVFEMKQQQQCPPGPFTLYFSLPGPVDPRLFSPCFRSDGIFEGVVAKFE